MNKTRATLKFLRFVSSQLSHRQTFRYAEYEVTIFEDKMPEIRHSVQTSRRKPLVWPHLVDHICWTYYKDPDYYKSGRLLPGCYRFEYCTFRGRRRREWRKIS